MLFPDQCVTVQRLVSRTLNQPKNFFITKQQSFLSIIITVNVIFLLRKYRNVFMCVSETFLKTHISFLVFETAFCHINLSNKCQNAMLTMETLIYIRRNSSYEKVEQRRERGSTPFSPHFPVWVNKS